MLSKFAATAGARCRFLVQIPSVRGEEELLHTWKVCGTSGGEGGREVKEEEEDKGEKVSAAMGREERGRRSKGG